MKYLILAVIVIAIGCKQGNPNYNPYAPIGPGAHHECVDSTHEGCDGWCVCDGMGCKYATNARIMNHYVPIRDYQIEIVEDSLLIYDANRFVGAVYFGHGDYQGERIAPIDSLILKDNE